MNCRFMYAFLGLGITLCVITCTGHVAAETANGCCLYLVSFFLNQLNWILMVLLSSSFILHMLGFPSLFCYLWSDYIIHCNINYLSNLFHHISSLIIVTLSFQEFQFSVLFWVSNLYIYIYTRDLTRKSKKNKNIMKTNHHRRNKSSCPKIYGVEK
jgi:hypothetical protein